ncbi:phosphatidylinositol-binding protein scs2 [Gnomoniopsis smithogilvyi]|uniref:Phosphatidylinositol-binding protein scs2 n=1 Tax=Gnomoniopsis smithogilvyi TaxID=1191159 RepID=A0A9W8Z424_9PEZI|nr:phosphatidylinositol-binding protein scs2 [Gnomoniopsis smithogilvyi]
MSVEIEPFELGFRRPFTVEVAQILKLRNTNKQPVAFKVKTTAPKQYCVRPNSGRIEPGHEVEVSVLLQAMKQDPPADAKSRDKFLVQSVLISGDLEFSNVQTIWEAVPKSAVQEKKIRVNFLPAAGTEPAGVAATPVKQPHLTNGAEQTPPPAYYSSPDEHRPTSSGAAPSEATSDVRDDPDVTAPISQSPQPEIKQEGLRQRKEVTAADEKPSVPAVANAVRPQGTEGVPIQYVAILCLICFLLAYFFF